MGNLNLRQAAARHLSRFENGNWGFFVVISKPIFPISPSWLSCSPDYDSAQISYSLHTSEWIQRNGQNDHISNLEIYSFTLRNCIAQHGSFLHRWPLSELEEMVVGGREVGPYGFASTVYRLSNFHARSQFTPNNVSKHSGAIFHSRPDDCWVQQLPFWSQSRHKLTEETIALPSKQWNFTIHLIRRTSSKLDFFCWKKISGKLTKHIPLDGNEQRLEKEPDHPILIKTHIGYNLDFYFGLMFGCSDHGGNPIFPPWQPLQVWRWLGRNFISRLRGDHLERWRT